MTLQFVDGASLRVEQLALVIYGAPNVGKTSLALTASKPLLLDFDRGAHRAGNKSGKNVVVCKSWGDVANITADDIKGFDTVVIDTVGMCIEALAADIIRGNPKFMNATTHMLSLPGFGALKSRFKRWLATLRSYGVDIVLVAHAVEEQQGDDTVVRINAMGSSRQEVCQQADLMGRLAIVGKNRVLSFDPTAVAYGKNVGVEDTVVGAPGSNPLLLAVIIEKAKGLINASSEQSAIRQKELAELRERLERDATTAKKLTAESEAMGERNASGEEKRILLDVAESKGFAFDAKTKSFVAAK